MHFVLHWVEYSNSMLSVIGESVWKVNFYVLISQHNEFQEFSSVGVFSFKL